jgi:glycosyltransferase involved in cell wall biosynthesis
MTPTVSVVMSVYNGEKYLHEAIDSIINQTFTDFEFIIINDGSTDNSYAILERYFQQDNRIRLYHQENIGLTASLNKGIELARGDYIARQDADDISMPERIGQQVQQFHNDPNLAIVGTQAETIDDSGRILPEKVIRPLDHTSIRWYALYHNSFIHTSVMLRASKLRQHLLRYDEKVLYAQDFELWSRLLNYGQGKNINELLVQRRIHKDQIRNFFADKQNSIGELIRHNNLNQLGIDVSLSQATTIASWFFTLPPSLSLEDMQLYKVLFLSLRQLKKLDDIDPYVIRNIRRNLTFRLLNNLFEKRTISLRPIRRLWTSGLLGLMLQSDPQIAMSFAIQRISKSLAK